MRPYGVENPAVSAASAASATAVLSGSSAWMGVAGAAGPAGRSRLLTLHSRDPQTPIGRKHHLYWNKQSHLLQ
jgi:hypothetical protein